MRKNDRLCRANDWIIANTFWNKTIKVSYTFWAEERDTKSIIDYIVYTKWLQIYIWKVNIKVEAEVDTKHRPNNSGDQHCKTESWGL